MIKQLQIILWICTFTNIYAQGRSDLELWLGQNFLDQFLSRDVLHRLFESVQGESLAHKGIDVPILSKKSNALRNIARDPVYRFSNIRLHKVRLNQNDSRSTPHYINFVGDHHVLINEQRGFLRNARNAMWKFSDDQKPKSSKGAILPIEDAMPITPFQIDNDRIRVRFHGLNILMTTDFAVVVADRSSNEREYLNGNILMRAKDTYFAMDFTGNHSDPRLFRFKPIGKPQLRFGDLEVRFRGPVTASLPDIHAKLSARLYEKELGDYYAKRILDILETEFEQEMTGLIDQYVTRSLNRMLAHQNVSDVAVPRLILRDPVWKIEDGHIKVGFDLVSLSTECRRKLAASGIDYLDHSTFAALGSEALFAKCA